jgi:hypothetical protein
MVHHRVTGSRNGGLKNYNTVTATNNSENTNKKINE